MSSFENTPHQGDSRFAVKETAHSTATWRKSATNGGPIVKHERDKIVSTVSLRRTIEY